MKKYALLTALALLLAVPSFAHADETAAPETTAAATSEAAPATTPATDTAAPKAKHKHAHKVAKHHKKAKAESETK